MRVLLLNWLSGDDTTVAQYTRDRPNEHLVNAVRHVDEARAFREAGGGR